MATPNPPQVESVWPYLWAKSTPDSTERFHPLPLHLLDVAATAEEILCREPQSTRDRMGCILGLPWDEAQPWLLILIACHDLGKACPGFQSKWIGGHYLMAQSGLSHEKAPNTDINHAFVSQIALSGLLQERDWPVELAELIADAVGCHHGERASPNLLNTLEGDRRALGRDDWTRTRRSLFEGLLEVFKPSSIPTKLTLSGPDFMLLSGLTSFADWIGSNEEWFPFGTPEDCEELAGWMQRRRTNAGKALDAIGWESRKPLSLEERSFEEVFPKCSPARPLQVAVAQAVLSVKGPCILLLEAPMGEGKTEAAFYAHLELQRRFGHRGLYVALPTKATGNAMFERTLAFLHALKPGRGLDLQLLHGATLLNDTFQSLRLSGVHDSGRGGEIRAAEWFTHKKRALLSEYGVGTVDQALMPILPVRHQFVRLWGLANRVVVFDEIHAYDAYTGTLLVHLMRWLLALESSVVLLSATLPPAIRRKLADLVGAELPETEAAYPRLSVFQSGSVEQTHFEADPTRSQSIQLKGISPDLMTLRSAMEEHITNGGMGLALMNTVQRAQDLYRIFPDGELLERDGQRVGKRLPDGTEVFLFHARFPADRRQRRESQALAAFGKNGTRRGRKILIATQVAEQSLDLDFDCMVTDLAPIDLILQRAGRLWRHARDTRPIAEPTLLVAGLNGDTPPDFGKPLWWGAVYREDLLLSTWVLLRPKEHLMLPDEIDELVQAVYEGRVEISASLEGRMDKAMESEDGESFAHRCQANQAIIGLPDDASWNDPSRYTKADEDEPGLHPTLVAQTRLGEPSVVVIPLFTTDGFRREVTPDFADAKVWFLRAMSLSWKDVVKKLQAEGVPEGWKKSPLLRNCYPLKLGEQGRWTQDGAVRLDDDLGLVYEPKEVN